ncbi:MAG: hypothetical protein QXJ17_03420 [Nitrososphaeria archaeon]
MKINLKHAIINKLCAEGPMTDKDLINNLRKTGVEFSTRELNSTLLFLEIEGLIMTKWAGKDKKRIELINIERKEER